VNTCKHEWEIEYAPLAIETLPTALDDRDFKIVGQKYGRLYRQIDRWRRTCQHCLIEEITVVAEEECLMIFGEGQVAKQIYKVPIFE